MSEERLNRLQTTVSQLSPAEVGEAIKNLKICLEHAWEHRLDDREIQMSLSELQLEGAAAELRHKLVAGENDSESLDKWGKLFLVYIASDESLLGQVEEAVEDAKTCSTMFVIESLLILGGVVVLLKYRPKKVKFSKKEGLEIWWEENDVSVVSDLANAVSVLPKE
jgi:hypothetical protein